MRRTGQIDLPLHGGRAPRWLFEKMRSLARSISEVIVVEFGRDFFLERLSDPFWFQSFGCVLGFDWHSSGLTTTVCGALKEAFRDLTDYGIYVCGGKGATSRKTPQEIETINLKLGKDPRGLIYASRMVAKVDNNALQDGFNLYQHTFIFSPSEKQEFKWAVIQQGMSEAGSWARRYHWYSGSLHSFIDEPHKGIAGDKHFLTLNMVDHKKDKLRNLVSELSRRKPQENLSDTNKLKQDIDKLPQRHQVLISDVNPKFLDKIFLKTYEDKPKDFETLLSMQGIGAKTIRALALISDLIYGEPVSFRDPARFSFAHGGKDGYPYRIDLKRYQNTIEVMDKVISKTKIEHSEKVKALRRLHQFYHSP